MSPESKRGIPKERPTVTGGNIFTYSTYRGTPEDLQALLVLSRTPEFRAQYPDDVVFADEREIVGALRRNPDPRNIEPYLAEHAELRARFEERGISRYDCAWIQTGPRRIETLSPGR